MVELILQLTQPRAARAQRRWPLALTNRRYTMDSDIEKVIFTANDPTGRPTMLAYFRDGAWAVVIDGQRQPPGWPHSDLAAAAKAYTHLIFRKSE